LGYRTFPDPDAAYDDEATAAAAAEYLASADEPFFLCTSFANTHREFPSPEEAGIDPDSVQPPGPLPDVPPCRRDTAGFHGSISTLDDCGGTVVDALREQDLLGDTVLLYATDHGPPFKDMKCDLYDDGVRVSLVARFPEGPHGDTVEEFVSHEDLVPTLCEYLDIDVPTYVQGTSWLPAVTGGEFDGRGAVYGDVTYHAAYEPKRCVRTRRYRYIRRFDEYDTYVLPNIDSGPSKTFLVEQGLGDRTRSREALYDTYLDPNERENLIDDPGHEAVLADLRTALDDWMDRTDDPLLAGPVSKPQGVTSTRRDAIDVGDESEPADAR
jgi:N-sulfoglucosamine sulfohydrolase